MLEHAKSHKVNLQCDLCPMSVEKRYNSRYALAQHKRGMHGPGWNSPCGINFKWKSHYSRHLNSGCDTCDEYHANKRKKKVFVCKVNLLRTVHCMKHVYIQLVFVSMFENIFCTTVFLHRLISSLVSACSDGYFMLHSLNHFSTFQVQ